MRGVVTDAGPVLHLHEAGAEHLRACFRQVYLVAAVRTEVARHAPKLWSDSAPSWVRNVVPSGAAAARAASWIASGLIHAGEAYALAYAQEIGADLSLTDDNAARVLATSLQMTARGSLGVVLYAAEVGYVSREVASVHLDALANRSTLWLAPNVRESAAAAIAQIFAH